MKIDGHFVAAALPSTFDLLFLIDIFAFGRLLQNYNWPCVSVVFTLPWGAPRLKVSHVTWKKIHLGVFFLRVRVSLTEFTSCWPSSARKCNFFPPFVACESFFCVLVTVFLTHKTNWTHLLCCSNITKSQLWYNKGSNVAVFTTRLSCADVLLKEPSASAARWMLVFCLG